MKPEEREQKEIIKAKIQQFQTGDFMTNAESLFTVLGYASERRAKIDKEFLCQKGLNQEKALFQNWQEAGLICQVTGEDFSNQGSIFPNQFEAGRDKSYLFYAVELKGREYTRGTLAQITRYVNKLFPMPVFILFKYDEYLTLAIIDRRENKKEESKDVLEKVTLIRNISITNPHRAHREILYDLSYQELLTRYKFSNFGGLHQAWQKTLDTKELNKKFYRELSAWYFYAKSQVLFPDDVEKDTDKRNSINLIRLITRLIFVWFIKEKELIPEKLFDEDFLKDILDYSDKNSSTYYKAILQNLFFATLNLEMNKDKPDSRAFVTREDGYHSQQHLMPAYRYARFFKDPDKALTLFENIPFLNGGLFENLDLETEENGKRVIKRIDCFSDHPDNEIRLKVPDALFFSDLKKVDLSAIYEDRKHQSEEFRGIINIFKRYKFTIEENTPIEEEIALDPELLGKVFENLLASYNPETHTTARKATGSFYTPREIVDYMVDESLVAYLETQLKEQVPEFKDMEGLGGLIRDMLSYTEDAHQFKEDYKVETLINAIDNCKILDPACGSGAFPMGILHKLVYLLHKLDPQNERWMNKQIGRVKNAIRDVEPNEDVQFRENLIHDLEKNIESIEDAFLNNELDYGRKLYLIENCIYGVDIQPIAIQIAKLRFFISLVIDQRVDPDKPNLNIRALPNLETKFVAANTLIGLEKQISMRNRDITKLEDDLKNVRKNHFSARTRKEKIRLRKLDEKIRNEIAGLLINNNFSDKSARQLADWNPYDQNISSPFFNPEWMFGIPDGFDIVIGNPPYVEAKKLKDVSKTLHEFYSTYSGTADLYVYFYENGIKQLNKNGTLIFITSNKFIKTSYGEKLRKYFTGFRINEIVDFTDIHVFEALVASCIFSVSKSEVLDNKIKIVFANDTLSNFLDVASFVERNKFYLSQNELSEKIWQLESEIKLALKEKIEKDSVTLNDTGNVKIFRGVTTGYNPAFIISEEKRIELLKENFANNSIIKPILQGRNIKKWIYNKTSDFLIFTRKGINIDEFPSIKNYLNNFKKQLEPGVGRKPGNYYWYEIQDNTAYYPEFEKEKIIWGLTSDKWTFAYDNEKYFLPSNGYILTSSMIPIKYLLALINSKLMEFYFGFIGIMTAGGAYTLKYETVAEFPIKVISLNAQKPFITLVDQILSAKRENPQADTSELEGEIDKKVYELYGLTREEIAVVEGKNEKN